MQAESLGDVAWEKEVRRGEAFQEIVAAAKEHGSDVIVMGATGRSGLLRLLMGSVTRRVLQHLPCSLLTVKDEDLVEDLDEEDARMIKLLYAEGQALLAGKAYETALAKFDGVLARNPFHVPALAGRAEACEQLGQTEWARRCRRRAESLRLEHGS